MHWSDEHITSLVWGPISPSICWPTPLCLSIYAISWEDVSLFRGRSQKHSSRSCGSRCVTYQRILRKWTIFNCWTKSKSSKFSFLRSTRIHEAGIEQATVTMRCHGANSPEPRRHAVLGSDTSALRTADTSAMHAEDQQLYNRTSLPPGLIVVPCPSEETLCCPACPTRPLWADSRPQSLKLRVSFPCICSPPVCIIRSVTSLSLATTTCTPEHPFFSNHCYPNTSSDVTCVLGGGSFPVTTHGFFSRGVAAVRARRLFPADHIMGKGLISRLTSGSKIRLTTGFEPCPKGPAPSSLAAAHSLV